MLCELSGRNKVVGIKQLRKALQEGRAAKVFIARDADPRLIQPIEDACRRGGVPLEEAPTMVELGRACGIEVGAAAAALLRQD